MRVDVERGRKCYAAVPAHLEDVCERAGRRGLPGCSIDSRGCTVRLLEQWHRYVLAEILQG